jgi:hypothetical protein
LHRVPDPCWPCWNCLLHASASVIAVLVLSLLSRIGVASAAAIDWDHLGESREAPPLESSSIARQTDASRKRQIVQRLDRACIPAPYAASHRLTYPGCRTGRAFKFRTLSLSTPALQTGHVWHISLSCSHLRSNNDTTLRAGDPTADS